MRNLIRATALAAALTMPLAASAAHHRGAGDSGSGARLTQMCEAGSRDIAGLPIEQIQRSTQVAGDARAALDELAGATQKAAKDLKAACPTETPTTAPARLAAMQARIEAMIAAVATVRPPLEKFYDLLSDEQKERVNTLTRGRGTGLLELDCGATQVGVAAWPTADIERRVRPTQAQRESLTTLQDAAAKTADIVKGSCPSQAPLSPPARLTAIGSRLDAMLQSIKTMSGPLDDFYGMLDDEQKARFDGISLPRTSQIEQPRGRSHRYHHVSPFAFIRRLFDLF